MNSDLLPSTQQHYKSSPNMSFLSRVKTAWDLIRGDDMITTLESSGILGAIFPSTRGDPPKRGTQELLEAYSTMPWLRAVTDKIGTATAATTWRLFATKKPGASRHFKASATQSCQIFDKREKMLKKHLDYGELVEITDHPGLNLLHEANTYHMGSSGRKLLQVSLDLTGEFTILLERDPTFNIPVAFWPLPTSWVIETPTPKHPYFVISLGGKPYDIPLTEIIWQTDPDPVNPYSRGSAISSSLGDELDTIEYAAKNLKSYFLNRGRPDFIAHVKPKRNEDEVSKKQLKQLQQSWMQEHMGFFRMFKPHFINRELSIHEFSQDFRKQQVIPIMEHERDTIIQVYGLPPEVFGILESSNRATIAAADYFFSKYAVLPRLDFQREVFQRRLIPMYDERLIVHFDSPVMEDKDQMLVGAKAAPWALTRDQWGELIGVPMPDDGEGNVRMVPNNVVGVTSLLDNSSRSKNTDKGNGSKSPTNAGQEE